MRYYRIPSFSGIEGHRNKPDRGTLRVIEGCMPYPVGGLRSGPVWTTLGTFANLNDQVSYTTDDAGNKYLFVSYSNFYALHAFPATTDYPKMGASIPSLSVLGSTFSGWSVVPKHIRPT